MKKLKKWDIVEIQWEDSVHEGGWCKEKKLLDEDEQLDHHTVGYLLEETKRYVSVVQSYGDVKDDEGVRLVDSSMMIPKRSIINIKKI